MVLGFKTQIKGRPTGFVNKILCGPIAYVIPLGYSQCQIAADLKPKIHTIRRDRLKRWKAGRSIQFAINHRQPEYEQFAVGVCQSVQEIAMRLTPTGGLLLAIDGHVLSEDELTELAINDGFSDADEFRAWFTPEVSDNFGYEEYRLIHWTDKVYQYPTHLHRCPSIRIF